MSDLPTAKRQKKVGDEKTGDVESPPAATAQQLKGAPPGTTSFPLVGRLSKEPRLKGKVAFISGGSRGFGQAIAIRFVEEGARVVVFSRGGCDETLKLIGKIEGVDDANAVALSCKCDMSSEADVQVSRSGKTRRAVGLLRC